MQHNTKKFLTINVFPNAEPEVVYEGELDKDGIVMGAVEPETIPQLIRNLPFSSYCFIKHDSEMTAKEKEQLAKGDLDGLFVPYNQGQNREIRFIQSCTSIDKVYQDKNGYTPETNDYLGQDLEVGLSEYDLATTPKQFVDFVKNCNGNTSNPNRSPKADSIFEVIDTEKYLKEEQAQAEKKASEIQEQMAILKDDNRTAIAKVISGLEFNEDASMAHYQLIKYLDNYYEDFAKRLSDAKELVKNSIMNGFQSTPPLYSVVENKLTANNDESIVIDLGGKLVNNTQKANKAVEEIFKDKVLFEKFFNNK